MATETETEKELLETLTSLEDVEVNTMGLVERGAVGETFFLLKRDGGDGMDSEDDIELTEETIQDPGFFEKLGRLRFLKLLNKGIAAEEQEDTPAEPETVTEPEPEPEQNEVEKALSAEVKRAVMDLIRSYGDDLPPNVVGLLRGLMGGSGDMKDKGNKTKTEKKDYEVETMEKEEVKEPITTQSEVATPVEKAEETAPPAVDKELVARLEKAEAATQATLARLEKAEQELEKARESARQERDARQRVTYIEKARELQYLGVNADDLGGILHRLAKADQVANIEKAEDAEDRQTDMDKVYSILKAADEQLKLAGFFKEAGTTKNPGEMDLIDKAAALVEKGDYASLKEALLAVSDEEAEAYRSKFGPKN